MGGGPTRKLYAAGVRDFVYSTFWLNDMTESAAGAGKPVARPDENAVATTWPLAGSLQDAFSRMYGSNLIASNGDTDGNSQSGSGIWPANTSAPFVQHYNPTKHQGQGWMGVVDLVSPSPSGELAGDVPLHHDAPSSSDSDARTVNATFLDLQAGDSIHLVASVDNVTCKLDAEVESGGGTYAFVAVSGLQSTLGVYEGKCA